MPRQRALGAQALHLIEIEVSESEAGAAEPRAGKSVDRARAARRRAVEKASVRPEPGTSSALGREAERAPSYWVGAHDLVGMMPVHLVGGVVDAAIRRDGKREGGAVK